MTDPAPDGGGAEPLARYARNVTSQNGEDGILAEILRRLDVSRGFAVEFGAWDGKHLSNTWDLWARRGWSAVLIEGDAERFRVLEDAVRPFPAVRALRAFVRPSGEDALEALLERCGAPGEIDVLSVDIDGDEYHVLAGLRRLRPRVVVAEFNPTIPDHVDLVQRPGEYFGASARALVRLGSTLGYGLAACTATNVLLVERRSFARLGFPEPDLTALFPRGHLTHLITAYDGRTFLSRQPTYAGEIPPFGARTIARELAVDLATGAPSGWRDAPFDGTAPFPVRVFALPRALERRSLPARLARALAAAVGRGRPAAPRGPDDEIAAWEARGRPVPPPHAHKQREILRYAGRFGLTRLVETGTYLGDMVEAMRGRFERIVSIELDPALRARAAERFAAAPHVTILEGDSAEVLPRAIETLDGPALYWLDGHYSEGFTARGAKETPIVEELTAILRRPSDVGVALVDDARCFDGGSDYPTLAALEALVRSLRPDATFQVADDVVRITWGHPRT